MALLARSVLRGGSGPLWPLVLGMGLIDGQSVKNTESGGPRGFDAGTKIKGRKRQNETETGGLLVTAMSSWRPH